MKPIPQGAEIAGRGGFGWRDKKFGFSHVEFQMTMGQPSRSVRQVVRDARPNGGKELWIGEVKLGVTGIDVVLKALRFDEVTQREAVYSRT